jgi:hypothetical protein
MQLTSMQGEQATNTSIDRLQSCLSVHIIFLSDGKFGLLSLLVAKMRRNGTLCRIVLSLMDKHQHTRNDQQCFFKQRETNSHVKGKRSVYVCDIYSVFE